MADNKQPDTMCVPVRFTGENFRQETAQRKMENMKKLITD